MSTTHIVRLASTTKRTVIIVGAVLGVALLALVGSLVMFLFSVVSTGMTKRSPDGQHVARLSRVEGSDVSFKVTVDGSSVYSSPDFASVRADFREQLVWDDKSQVVMLEVAGQRIFGYHADEKRPLVDSELLRIQVTPFEELRFEGTLPKEIMTR